MVQRFPKLTRQLDCLLQRNSLLFQIIFLKFGSESQKSRWLPKLASGEWIGAWGLTEHNTGSDAGGMNSTAVKDGDHWV